MRKGIFTQNTFVSSRTTCQSPFTPGRADLAGGGRGKKESVKISTHGDKIRMSLNDTFFLRADGARESRSFSSGERTQEARHIDEASIRFWINSTPEIRIKVPLSGELSFLLPPVTNLHHKQQPLKLLSKTDGNNKYLTAERLPRPPPSQRVERLGRDFRSSKNMKFTSPLSAEHHPPLSTDKKIIPKSSKEKIGGIYTSKPTGQVLQRRHISIESTMTRGGKRVQRQQSISDNNIATGDCQLPKMNLKPKESDMCQLNVLAEENSARLGKQVKRSTNISESQNGGMKTIPFKTITPANYANKRGNNTDDNNNLTLFRRRSRKLGSVSPPSHKELTLIKKADRNLTGVRKDKTVNENFAKEGKPKSTKSRTPELFLSDKKKVQSSDFKLNLDDSPTVRLPFSVKSENNNTGSSSGNETKTNPVPTFRMIVHTVDIESQEKTCPRREGRDDTEDESERSSSSSRLSVCTSVLFSEMRPSLPLQNESIATLHTTRLDTESDIYSASSLPNKDVSIPESEKISSLIHKINCQDPVPIFRMIIEAVEDTLQPQDETKDNEGQESLVIGEHREIISFSQLSVPEIDVSESRPHTILDEKRTEIYIRRTDIELDSKGPLPNTALSVFKASETASRFGPFTSSQPLEKGSRTFHMTMESVDIMPQSKVLSTGTSEDTASNVYLADKRQSRSSGLLSVPRHDILSEVRPPLPMEFQKVSLVCLMSDFVETSHDTSELMPENS